MTFNFHPAPPLSEIVRQVQPGLVHINTSMGSGSGFIIDTTGHIITNAHVVAHSSTLTVEFTDGTQRTGLVLGIDEEIDLACIRISSPDPLMPFSMGDSDSAQVGEEVIAIGYPLGEMLRGSPTVTRGIISAKRVGEVQTDAAINPGNSGGPLIDTHGNVIGVNTSGFERVADRNITGINFAIPINVVKDKLGFLKSGGEVRKPTLSAPSDSRPCRQNNLVQMTIARIWQIARKDAAFLA